MVQELDASYHYAGFAKQAMKNIPHFCNVIVRNANNVSFCAVDMGSRRFAVPIQPMTLEIAANDFYFLNEAEQADINARYTIDPLIKVFYTGSDDCKNCTYGPDKVKARHFLFGTEQEIVQKIETTEWERLNRCFIDVYALCDLLQDSRKKRYLLEKKLHWFEENNATYRDEYAQVKEKLALLL